MKIIRCTALRIFGAAALWTLSVLPAAAQTDRFWLNPGTGDFATGGNWTGGITPEAEWNERAIINNGGVATLTSVALPPSAVLLGQAAGDSGTLEIGNNGNLYVELLPGNVGVGNVTVGGAGTGTLRVLPGGTLATDGALVSGNNAANTIVLGGTAAGTATVNVPSATLGGTTHAHRNVNFNASGQIVFQPTSVYNVEITAAGGPTLNSDWSTLMNGTLHVNFTGVTPTLGSSWDLFHAGGFGGAFSSVNVSGAPALGPGQRYAVNTLPVAPNRARGVLTLEQYLEVTVNRDDGSVTISNAGSQAFGIQGYTISSGAGSLSVSGWNSLDHQNALGGDWRESNPSANRLSELTPNGPVNLAGDGGQALLGGAFVPNPVAFGTEIEDLAFQYVKGDGTVASGVVKYTGAPRPNNLLLTVDPSSGEAQLKNTSTLSVAIDGYSIFSPTGSLSVSGWESLDFQNAAGGDWRESNPSPTRLRELKPDGSTLLSPGMNFHLGELFSTGGAPDLELTFHIAGQGQFPGVVTYGAIAAGVPGDYNNNGVVDAADYTVWRDNLGGATLVNRDPNAVGPVGQADYNFWKSRFGATSGSGSGSLLAAGSAVPEPSSILLSLGACMGLALMKRRGWRA